MNRRVFIADDDSGLIDYYRCIFVDDDTVALHPHRRTSATVQLETFTDGSFLAERFESEAAAGLRVPLCILDMRMHHLDGLRTAERLRQSDPDVVILVVTAFSDINATEARKRLKDNVFFVKKPFNDEELYALVLSLLDGWNQRQELRSANERLTCLLDAIPASVAVSDTTTGEMLFANATLRSHAGDDFEGRKRVGYVPWDNVDANRRLAPDATHPVTGAIPVEQAESDFLSQTSGRWFHVSRRHLTWMDNRPVVFESAVDITGRKAAESTLRQLLQDQKTLLSMIPGMVFFKDRDLRFLTVNEAFSLAVRRPLDEIPGKTDFDFEPPERAEHFREIDRSVIETGQSLIGVEEHSVDADGKPRFGWTAKVPCRDEHGKITGLVGIAFDITETKLAQQRLRDSDALLASIYKAVPIGICVTDSNGCFISVNDAFCTLTGYDREEIVATPFVRLMSAAAARRASAWYAQLIDGRQDDAPPEIRVVKKDGSIAMMRVSTARLVMTDGAHAQVTAVVDITDERRSEAELGKAHRAAEIANRAKNEFLASVSHEIRTPLNGVIGMTELMLGTELSDEQRGFAEVVKASGQSLLSVINDILDFSRIEAGQLEPDAVDFDLRLAVEEVLDIVAAPAREKGLNATCLVDPDVPSLVKGDPGRLRQILTNLAGNATKFTETGEIAIRASLVNEDGARATVRFEIHDTGIGIAQEDQGRLFERFSQVDGSLTRRYGGTGLGLAISKRLTMILGGTIGCESKLGQGSVFWVELPFEKQPADSLADFATGASLKGRRIIVVDDVPGNLDILELQLRGWGCRPARSQTGPEAFRLMREAAADGDPFEVAIIDMQMPAMDGETLGRLIKADMTLSPTVLVLLTSIGLRGDAVRLQEAGFSVYLTKPVKQTDLRKCLETALSRKKADEEKSGTGSIITKYSVPEEAKRSLRILLAEDNAINQLVATKILDRLGYRSDAVSNGRQALDAVNSGSYDLVLMDCQMPEMDGFEATGLIRRSETAGRRIPIVALTASALEGDREACIAAGMDDYLAKPIQPAALAQVVERWLNPGSAAIPDA